MDSDDSSLDSEEEYIPNPQDESTKSESSLELTLEDEKKKTCAIRDGRRKSSSQCKIEQSESKCSSQSLPGHEQKTTGRSYAPTHRKI